MTKEAYDYLLSLGYMDHNIIHAIYMGNANAQYELNRDHYEEYCRLNEEEPMPEAEMDPLTEGQIEAIETAIDWLEENIRRNKEKARRVAEDRKKANQKVKKSYRLTK